MTSSLPFYAKYSFDINFKGFLLPVKAVDNSDGLYEITFPDTSTIKIEKKESHFRIIHSRLSRYLRYLTGESRVQEFGSLIEKRRAVLPE